MGISPRALRCKAKKKTLEATKKKKNSQRTNFLLRAARFRHVTVHCLLSGLVGWSPSRAFLQAPWNFLSCFQSLFLLPWFPYLDCWFDIPLRCCWLTEWAHFVSMCFPSMQYTFLFCLILVYCVIEFLNVCVFIRPAEPLRSRIGKHRFLSFRQPWSTPWWSRSPRWLRASSTDMAKTVFMSFVVSEISCSCTGCPGFGGCGSIPEKELPIADRPQHIYFVQICFLLFPNCRQYSFRLCGNSVEWLTYNVRTPASPLAERHTGNKKNLICKRNDMKVLKVYWKR